ncbi:hypothetical protein X975_13198, partial [Stegodyphus mimosarum]
MAVYFRFHCEDSQVFKCRTYDNSIVALLGFQRNHGHLLLGRANKLTICSTKAQHGRRKFMKYLWWNPRRRQCNIELSFIASQKKERTARAKTIVISMYVYSHL